MPCRAAACRCPAVLAVVLAAIVDRGSGGPLQAPATTAERIQALIGGERHPAPHGADLGHRREWMRALYAPLQEPVWSEGGRPASHAWTALGALEEAVASGLDPDDYDAAWLRAIAERAATGSASAADVTAFDAGLSLAVLRLLAHAHMGRVDPRRLGFDYHVNAREHDFGVLLKQAVARGQVAGLVAQVEPPLPQYRRLKEALARYRTLARNTALRRVAVVRLVRPGDAYRDAAALEELLRAFGDLGSEASRRAHGEAPPPVAPAPYEGALVEAVKHFQARHSLVPDGILGQATFRQLNVTPGERARQLELAMERLRWLPHISTGAFVVVNVPAFRLVAFRSPEEEAPSLQMPVIVGRAARTRTPLFTAEMRELIFRPYWYPPDSILYGEILPALRRHPGYLAENDMEIVAGFDEGSRPLAATPANIGRLRSGALRLRQRPGPGNALGLLKFVFPNDYTVYMHGTPAQELFGRPRRDFSHGCIRVADPAALAEFVLADRDWTRPRVEELMDGARTLRVGLPHPVPVLVFYTTAIVRGDGTVEFYDDVYGEDRQLEGAIGRHPR